MNIGDLFTKLKGSSPLTSLGALAYIAGKIVAVTVDPTIGQILETAGVGLIGLASRDNNVTSEQAGAK